MRIRTGQKSQLFGGKMEKDRIDLYLSYVPTKAQKRAQRENFNIFFHYGLNTFTGKEWGDGKADPSLFNPSEQNTDQWIKTAKDAGAYGVILTCKHHDGFCLWQTATTNYGVASSPYKGGKGDIVREVSDSCRKYGIKFGVYLSPWDRNHESYSTPAYNDVYCAQLKELLTNYGEVWCVWLDGACGSYMDGKPRQEYDWQRYYALIRSLQPDACISGCAPDIRWVGNEGGFARESEWNVVPEFACDIQTIQANSQQKDDGKFAKKGADIVYSDLGSREFLANFDKFMWYPAEVDVSIRPGWFYHASQDNMLKSRSRLLKIYYDSVGGNSMLLLNLPPDRRGLIHENDVEAARLLGEHIRKSDAQYISPVSVTAPDSEKGCEVQNITEYSFDKSTCDPYGYYTPAKESDAYKIVLRYDKEYLINRVRLVENTAFSQRVETFSIYAVVRGKRKKVYDGTTIGYNRIAVFKPVLTDCVEVVFTQVRRKPYIEFIGAYEDNGYVNKKPAFFRFRQWLHKVIYESFINRENKNAEKRYREIQNTQSEK